MIRDIKEFENYTISKDGVVTNKVTGHVKSCYIGKVGYPVVSLYSNGIKKECLLHRLLAVAFIPNPDNKPYVNHKDGIKAHSVLANLEWVTASENMQHAYGHGLIEKPVAISSMEAEKYLYRILQGCSITTIADETGLAISTVAKHVRRISKDLHLEESLDKVLTEQKLQRTLRLNDYPRKRSTLK